MYRTILSRSTPSQKLIRAAVVWEWTLCVRRGRGQDEGGVKGIERERTHQGSGASRLGMMTEDNCAVILLNNILIYMYIYIRPIVFVSSVH
jgi:hypothetical protein